MIRPFTCVCLILAAGSGLYLYQVKQRAFALDASLRSTFHDIDGARERTRMLRADWALVNDPERLQALASQYLTLQPMQPSQLLTMDRLAAALPPPVPLDAALAPAALVRLPAPVIDPTHGMPMAELGPQVLPHTHPVPPEVALLQPKLPASPSVSSDGVSADPLPPLVAAPAPISGPISEPGPAPALAPLSALPPPVTATVAAAPHLVPAVVGGSPRPVPAHHWVHHSASPSDPWLAQANGFQAETHKRAAHRSTPASSPALRQFYAANDAPREADPAPRITPPAATVMYRPASSGSSLGMASSASLAPPRPLYSTSQ